MLHLTLARSVWSSCKVFDSNDASRAVENSKRLKWEYAAKALYEDNEIESETTLADWRAGAWCSKHSEKASFACLSPNGGQREDLERTACSRRERAQIDSLHG